MLEEDVETSLKIIVIGNGGVGKDTFWTSLIQRFCKNTYTDVYKKTIGVDFLEKPGFFVASANETVTLMLWDTAGQEEFDGITKNYYKGAIGAVIAFSTTDRASFEALESWKSKVEAQCPRIATVLVQNKIDLIDQAKVSQTDAEAAASRLGLGLYRLSVKENLNVSEMFGHLAAQCIKLRRSGANQAEPSVGGSGAGQARPASAGTTDKAFQVSGTSSGSEKRQKKGPKCLLL